MEFTHLIGTGSVQESYSQQDLKTKVVIRNETNNHYFVFNCQKEFEKWYNKQKNKYYHEIIFGFQTQRIKFDIDGNETLEDSFITLLINKIIEVVSELFGTQLTKKDFIVTDSSGPTEKGLKRSYHVILFTHAVKDNEEAKYITKLVCDKLPSIKFIDQGVNKRIQSFRLLGSAKNGRIKKYHLVSSLVIVHHY